MKKQDYVWLLLALVCSLGFTACSDDDNNSEGGGVTEQTESTGGDMTMAEMQLASLIESFGGMDAQEQLNQANWKQKSYEATVGLVMNESQPTVRSVQVGTLEVADEQAVMLLEALGIDMANPSGFLFNDPEVGTVSYQHNEGDANTLATINISVRQLPGITQLQMVRQYPTNADGAPYYQQGDVIKKDGRLWICTNPASAVGQQAYFVSFWTEDHPTGTCGWGKEDDIVYAAKKPMANANALVAWMEHILLDDQNYSNLISRLENKTDIDIDQVVPSTSERRNELMNSLLCLDVNGLLLDLPTSSATMNKYKWESKDNDKGMVMAPRGLMLCDKFRWSTGNGRSYKYWVPFLYLIPGTEYNDHKKVLDKISMQNEKSHFQWCAYGSRFVKSDIFRSKNSENTYDIIKASVYWTHKYYDKNQWAVYDFTKDWKNYLLPLSDTKAVDWQLDKFAWTRRNIVSSQLIYTDKGGIMKGAENVWTVKGNHEEEGPKEQEVEDLDGQKLPPYPMTPLLGSIITANGQITDSYLTAEEDGGAVALVAWMGDEVRAEDGTLYNGLAIALDTSEPVSWMSSGQMSDCYVHQENSFSMLNQAPNNGLKITKMMRNGCRNNHQHNAPKAYGNLPVLSEETRTRFGWSQWFIGTYPQYVKVMKGLRVAFDQQTGFADNWSKSGVVLLNAQLSDLYTKLTTQRLWTNSVYMTSSQEKVWTVKLKESNPDNLRINPSEASDCRVLYLMAFIYGEGGQKDDENAE